MKFNDRDGFHKANIIPYLKKHEIYHDSILFIFNSCDAYMKNAFLRHRWVENPLIDSYLFDIRWDFNENPVIV